MSKSMAIDREHFRVALQRTPFHDRFVALSKDEEWMGWNTYKVPRVVDKVSTEYFAVRNGSARGNGPDADGEVSHHRQGRSCVSSIALLPGIFPNSGPGLLPTLSGAMTMARSSMMARCFNSTRRPTACVRSSISWTGCSYAALGFEVQIEVETHDVRCAGRAGPDFPMQYLLPPASTTWIN